MKRLKIPSQITTFVINLHNVGMIAVRCHSIEHVSAEVVNSHAGERHIEGEQAVLGGMMRV